TAITGLPRRSVAGLWATYGSHVHPRANLEVEARVIHYASRLHHPFQAGMIQAFARWHLLPEPYLYGLADVGFTADFSHTYLFGKVYPHGQWFYFPAAFVIKSTLALLILMLLVPVAIVAGRMNRGRELLFLVIPATIYFAAV